MLTSPFWFRFLAKRNAPGLCGLFLCSQLLSQVQAGKQATDRSVQMYIGAANGWQLSPVDESEQRDLAGRELRAKREAYLKASVEELQKLIGDLALESSASLFGSELNASEIQNLPKSIWVIAKFESYQTFQFPLASAKHFVYTEIHYRTLQVIRQPAGSFIAPGDTFDEEFRGGTIKSVGGDILQQGLSPQKYFPRPGETYLLQINYDPTTHYCNTVRRWDVTTGKLVPDTDIQATYYAEGKSPISGLYLSQAVHYLESIL